MKKQFISALVLSVFSVSAFAGVAEKKATRAANEAIAAAAAETKTACGNASLEVNVAWAEFDAMAESNAALLEKKNQKMIWVIGQAGERTAGTLKALTKICADEDYKEEIGKLTTVTVSAKPAFDDYKSDYSLEGTNLKVATGYYMSRSASDFVERLKALY
jgi:hypothetical protein